MTFQDGKPVPPPPGVHSEWIKDAVLKQITDYTFDITINTNPAAPVPPGTVHIIVAPDGKTLTMTNTVTAAISVFDREQ